MISVLALIIGLLVGSAYIIGLVRLSNDNNKFFKLLLIVAGATFLLNAVSDGIVINSIGNGQTSLFAIVMLAIFHSLEIFIFQTHFFDNGYQEYFFGQWNYTADPAKLIWGGESVYVYVFTITFLLATITSASLIIRAFGQRNTGRKWLKNNSTQNGTTHIFFLGDNLAELIAKDIKNIHPDDKCIYIGHIESGTAYFGMSLWEKLLKIMTSIGNKDSTQDFFDARIYSRLYLKETGGKPVCEAMNLTDLDKFLKNTTNKVYLLSDNEEENLQGSEILYRDHCKATIFCRACREGLNSMYEESMSNTPMTNIHLVDSSYLAVRNIKNHPELLPVNFVDKGTDDQGRLEGWVSSEFNAMIIGFGEMGHEALGFLCEHAAFVNKDFKKNSFSCIVMDQRMNELKKKQIITTPCLDESFGIEYLKCEIGNNDFWQYIENNILKLNYIVVCLGNDRLNLKTAIDILVYAYRIGKDLSHNFVILVAQESATHLDTITLKHYNSVQQYHNCIRPFGENNEVWTYANITNDDVQNRAKQYFSSYMKANDKENSESVWEKRETNILRTDDYALYSKLIRQRSQDYANCFHTDTKMALMDKQILDNRHTIARSIPPSYKGCFYTGNDSYVEKVLLYLAVGEHIRWEASHKVLGYTYAPQTDDIKKTHNCLIDFEKIDDEIKHYDYLVVKTTLDMGV